MEGIAMVTIHFVEEDRFLCERQWPSVPRAGEFVTLRQPSGRYVVAEVKWECRQPGPVVHVMLEQLIGAE
jgi:hypothetical protein